MSHSSRHQIAHSPHSPKELDGQAAELTGDGSDHLCLPSPTDDHDRHQYPPLRRAILITVALGLSTFCVALDNTVLATAIPKICEEFDSLKDMSWYASSYLLTCSTFMLSFGRMYTLYPSKWIYLTALALFELGSLVSAATPTSIGLILGRAIAGIGAAGLLPGPMIIISELVPLCQRPTLMAVIAVLPALAVVCGPMIGGVLTERVTWRWCFYINLPLGAFTAVALLIFLPSTNRYKSDRSSIRHFDWIGMATLVSGLVSLLLALQWGGSKYQWTNARIIVLLILAGVLTIVWVGVQRWKQEDATVPPRLLKHRNLVGVILYAACVSGAFTVLIYYLPIWFQAVKGSSPSMSGVMNVPMVLGMIIVSFLAAWLITTLGYLTPFLVLGTVITAIGVGLCSNLQTNSGSAQWIGYQAMVGMGFGLAYSLPPLAAQAAVRPEDVSLATTLVTFMQNVAGAILVTAAQDIFQSRLVVNLAHQAPGLDTRLIIQGGVTDLSERVDHGMLPSVLSAYNLSITQTLYLAVAATSLSLVGGVIMHPKLSIKANSEGGISPNDVPQVETVETRGSRLHNQV